jgi:hypothetical protein
MNKLSRKARITLATLLTMVLIGSVVMYALWPMGQAKAASTLTAASVDDWNACAQNTIEESAVMTNNNGYGLTVLIQAFLDSTTAHTGTKFTIQVSSNSTGDEDWHDFYSFVPTDLVDTAATDLIEDNPLAATSTSLTLTGHALTEEGIWIGIEDGTLVNSELIFVASQTANAVVALDGTTNEHAQNTAVFDAAISQTYFVPMGIGVRARVIIDNSYDDNGSTLNYRIRSIEADAL